MLKQNIDGLFNLDEDNIHEAIDELAHLRDEISLVKPYDERAKLLSKSIAHYLINIGDKYAETLTTVATVTTTYDKYWVWEVSSNDPPGTIGLKDLIPKTLWNDVTDRVVNSEKLDEKVREGLINIEDIAPAYAQKVKAVFTRTK